LINRGIIHPDEKLGYCSIFWLDQDQTEEELAKIAHDKRIANSSVAFDMFSGLSAADLSILDSEHALIDLEYGPKHEGILKVTYSNGQPSIHFLPTKSDLLFLVPFSLEESYGRNQSYLNQKLRLNDLRATVSFLSSMKKKMPSIFDVNFPKSTSKNEAQLELGENVGRSSGADDLKKTVFGTSSYNNQKAGSGLHSSS